MLNRAGQRMVIKGGMWVALLVLSSRRIAADENDLVTNLPGQPNVPFKQYAGYVPLQPAPKERSLFYWFFEADHPNASSRPVALWLQGGPGCSSTGLGAVSETGPLLIQNGTLVYNRHSWNKEVNLLFLDSPVGTGFSICEDDDYEFNDLNTALDSYRFLVGWLQKFPQYSSNELYLLGESYAGHYVPQLAVKILFENKKSGSTRLNFKGFLIGNPWTDSYSDNRGALEWYLSHSLISEESFNLALSNCDLDRSFYVGDEGNKACQDASRQIDGDLREVILENVYQAACNIENTTSNGSFSNLQVQLHKKHKRPSSIWHHGLNPCASDGVSTYLNSQKVQTALHVRTPLNWSDCSDYVGYAYSHVDSVTSLLPIYRELLKTGLKMWIYSGDWDGNVPTTGTRRWIRQLDLPIVTKWHPWDYLSQVGGWTQVYEGLTFTTVRGAGHMVPTDQPGKALQVLQSFLSGQALPIFHLLSS